MRFVDPELFCYVTTSQIKRRLCSCDLAPMQDTVYFVKGACQEELVMQGRGKDAQVWLDSFDAVTQCTVQEVRFGACPAV